MNFGRWRTALSTLGPQATLVILDTQYNQTNGYDFATAGSVVSNGNGWNSGVYTNQQSIEDVGDYLEWTHEQYQYVMGLTYNSTPSTGWNEENFSFYFPNTTLFYARSEETWFIQSGAAGANVIGDVYRMEIIAGGFVNFSRNGTVFHTSTTAVAGPLFPHFTSGSGSGQVSNWEIFNA